MITGRNIVKCIGAVTGTCNSVIHRQFNTIKLNRISAICALNDSNRSSFRCGKENLRRTLKLQTGSKLDTVIRSTVEFGVEVKLAACIVRKEAFRSGNFATVVRYGHHVCRLHRLISRDVSFCIPCFIIEILAGSPNKVFGLCSVTVMEQTLSISTLLCYVFIYVITIDLFCLFCHQLYAGPSSSCCTAPCVKEYF